MASGLAGAKAGILAGIFFAAAAGLFNVGLLQLYRDSTLATLQTNAICTTPPHTPADCFSSIVTAVIPTFVMFPVAVLGIIFGALYGLYYEYLPGHGYPVKAVAIGMVMLIFMIVTDVAGSTSTVNTTQLSTVRAFDTLAMVGYSLILARFYRRFTREVQFQSPDPEKLKITVDGKNYTEKRKTLSVRSTHTIRAPSESGTFHQWLTSGGVSVLDPKSFETTMRVEGDGLLKIT